MAKRSGKNQSKRKKFVPDRSMRIIVLHGPDPFLIREHTRDVIEMLETSYGKIEKFTYDGAESSPADVLDELRSYGLMQAHKLVIVDNADNFLSGKKKGQDGQVDSEESSRRRRIMENYAKSPVDSATLLMRSEGWHPGRFDKDVAKVGVVHKVEPPSEEKAISWCAGRCRKRYDCDIDADAAALLVRQTGPDLGRLDAELTKLAAAAAPVNGTGGRITRELVVELVGMSREEKVWSIQAPIAAGNPGAALQQLRDLERATPDTGGLQTVATWAVCDLLRKLHTAGQLLRAGQHPGSFKYKLKIFGDAEQPILNAARRIEPAVFADLFQQAIRTDADNKSGVGDPVRSLEALTVRVADTIRVGVR